jgi:hypothetical protein
MPCNLAVTIQKAFVSSEQIQALMTPEIVEKAVKAYLSGHETYKNYQPITAYIMADGVIAYLSGTAAYTIQVTKSEVFVKFPERLEAEGNLLAEQLTVLLKAVGGKLLAAYVRKTLGKSFNSNVAQESATVDNAGQQQQVVKLSFEV